MRAASVLSEREAT